MKESKTELYIETSEFFIVRRRRCFFRLICPECDREVIMTKVSEAAFISCRTSRTVLLLIGEGTVHSRYFETKGLFVCVRSLLLAA